MADLYVLDSLTFIDCSVTDIKLLPQFLELVTKKYLALAKGRGIKPLGFPRVAVERRSTNREVFNVTVRALIQIPR